MPKPSAKQELILRGTPASEGVAHGVVQFIGGDFDEPVARRILARDVNLEIKRFHLALDGARRDLKEMIAGFDAKADRNARDILEMHLMVLDDPQMTTQTETRIRDRQEDAASAYYRIARECMDAFNRMPDDYLRERALDIRDVAQRVMRHLQGKSAHRIHVTHPAIFVAHDLTPTETAQLDRGKVLGFAIEVGSRTSHTAIMARSLGFPAVVRLHGLLESLHHGDEVLVDGDEGLFIIHPSAKTLADYRKREKHAEKREARLLAESREPAVTLDGAQITVAANAEFTEELEHIRACGADGVGLFRTEFIHLESPDATEDELTKVYTRIVKGLAPALVIFRTLDVGGDKIDAAMNNETEQNPFLGWRGIRVSLAKKSIFKQQLRAILRAGAHGNAGIMYPMVSGVHEVIAANHVLAECRAELSAARIKIPERVQVGTMIEVPGAAAIADLIAPHVDFFSIGTNDLTQYTLAVDRVNERVSELYQPTHPAVLRLIRTVVEAAHQAGIWAGLCGEMAGDVTVTPLLIGLGLDELSAASSQVAKIRHAIRKLDTVQCRQLVEQALRESDPAEIQRLSEEFAERQYAELFEG
ncbi:MAG TPA: phosphoenolpyruvate--protein phosphotransferase [Verrucomicrobiaceae bacterium]